MRHHPHLPRLGLVLLFAALVAPACARPSAAPPPSRPVVKPIPCVAPAPSATPSAAPPAAPPQPEERTTALRPAGGEICLIDPTADALAKNFPAALGDASTVALAVQNARTGRREIYVIDTEDEDVAQVLPLTLATWRDLKAQGYETMTSGEKANIAIDYPDDLFTAEGRELALQDSSTDAVLARARVETVPRWVRRGEGHVTDCRAMGVMDAQAWIDVRRGVAVSALVYSVGDLCEDITPCGVFVRALGSK